MVKLGPGSGAVLFPYDLSGEADGAATLSRSVTRHPAIESSGSFGLPGCVPHRISHRGMAIRDDRQQEVGRIVFKSSMDRIRSRIGTSRTPLERRHQRPFFGDGGLVLVFTDLDL